MSFNISLDESQRIKTMNIIKRGKNNQGAQNDNNDNASPNYYHLIALFDHLTIVSFMY